MAGRSIRLAAGRMDMHARYAFFGRHELMMLFLSCYSLALCVFAVFCFAIFNVLDHIRIELRVVVV
jgi:hypothetical protein